MRYSGSRRRLQERSTKADQLLHRAGRALVPATVAGRCQTEQLADLAPRQATAIVQLGSEEGPLLVGEERRWATFPLRIDEVGNLGVDLVLEARDQASVAAGADAGANPANRAKRVRLLLLRQRLAPRCIAMAVVAAAARAQL